MRFATRHPALLPRLLLSGGLLAYALLFQGSRGLWEPDEGRYVAVALEMLRTGELLEPRLHHERPHLAKPPLTYWVLAGSFRLFGENEWAARLPNALAFCGLVLLVGRLARRLVPDRRTMAPLIFATMPLPFAAAHLITADTLLALWETIAVLGFVEAEWGDPNRSRFFAAVLWIGSGLGFLTKGPPALLPLIAIGGFVAWTRGLRAAKRLLAIPGLVAFGLVGLGWYFWVIEREQGALGYFLRQELFGRFFTGIHHRNAEWYGAFVVYIPALLVGAFPWIFCAFRRTGREPGSRDDEESGCPPVERRDRGRFVSLWFFVPLAFFVVARSRLPFYLLPLFVPLALMLSRRVPPWQGLSPRGRVGVVSWVLLLVALKGALVFASPFDKDGRSLARAIRPALGFEPEEIVFVDSRPVWSLALYFGCEVEEVALRAPGRLPSPVREQSLREEWAELEGPRLYLVPGSEATSFERTAGEVGYRAIELGRAGPFVAFAVPAADRPTGRPGVPD